MNRQNSKQNRWGGLIAGTANWVVRIAGSVIFLVLVWYSFRYTQYMVPLEGHEFPVDIKDSMLQNLMTAALFTAFAVCLLYLEKRLGEKTKRWIMRTLAGVAMLWQGIWGALWITAADRCPKGDQLQVFGTAVGVLSGDYSALNKGAYCDIYPHQLSLVSLEEGLFRLFHNTDYHMLQWICVLMIVGIVFFSYRVVRELTEHMAPAVLVCLLHLLCTAPIFYACWVYGEVPSVFFAMLAAWMLARYEKRGGVGSLIWLVAALTMAVLVRKNSMILVIAFCLVALAALFARFDRKLLVAVILSVAVPALAYAGIYKMYETRSGYEHVKGIPPGAHMYIGLQETVGRYGWYYLGATDVYFDNDMDTERTRVAVNEMLRERWAQMRSQPGYLVTFYKGKMLSQWNAPLYQSMYFNYVHEEVHFPKITEFFDRLSGEYFSAILWEADRLQILVYLGMLLYCIFGTKRDSNPTQHMLTVTMIGGFLFSIIWEAKTRYVFPYYMMMFPFAALGYPYALQALKPLVFSLKKRYNNQSVSKTDGRGRTRECPGEESPGFTGQDAG